jgi:enterochelin esterase-like enzyme
LVVCSAACSDDQNAPSQAAGSPSTAGTTSGAAASAGNAGSSQVAGSAGGPAASGGTSAVAGSAGQSAGGPNAGSGGSSGQAAGGQAGGGQAAGGQAGSGGGPPATGSCPKTLPTLAGDNDTSFYALRQDIPHGVIKEVQYKQGGNKTMHVYTPPDYETNAAAKYPVLYINHGGGEGDSHWGCTNANNCGYAGRILDNLLADGKAVPMVIAMPDTGDCANFNPPAPPDFTDPCTTQYVSDFIPYIEKTYRVKADRHSRAIAGLSMGGLVTLNTGFGHLELFSHVFVYSSGYLADARPKWETNLSSVLGDSKTTNGLLNAPVYLAAGATDTALPNAQAVRDIFKKNDIAVLWQDSSKGHEWANWRRYLAQTLPLMFKNTSGCD